MRSHVALLAFLGALVAAATLVQAEEQPKADAKPEYLFVQTAKGGSFRKEHLSEDNLANVRALNAIAERRGQTLAQMAIAWVLRQPSITSALIGASRWSQIEECLGALDAAPLSDDELSDIDRHALEGKLNLWAASSSAG